MALFFDKISILMMITDESAKLWTTQFFLLIVSKRDWHLCILLHLDYGRIHEEILYFKI